MKIDSAGLAITALLATHQNSELKLSNFRFLFIVVLLGQLNNALVFMFWLSGLTAYYIIIR